MWGNSLRKSDLVSDLRREKWENFNLPLTCEGHPLCSKVLLKVLRSFVLLEEVSELGKTYQQVCMLSSAIRVRRRKKKKNRKTWKAKREEAPCVWCSLAAYLGNLRGEHKRNRSLCMKSRLDKDLICRWAWSYIVIMARIVFLSSISFPILHNPSFKLGLTWGRRHSFFVSRSGVLVCCLGRFIWYLLILTKLYLKILQ